MQDELLGRMWTANHDTFAADVDRAAAALLAAGRRALGKAAPALNAVLFAAVLAVATLGAAETAALYVFAEGTIHV